jgi:formylglycine-generating enzyme required for sulfatase activity
MRISSTWAICLLVGLASLTHRQLSAQQKAQLRSIDGPNGHVLVVIPGGEFVMGSPASVHGRWQDEHAHPVRIPRTYAIATTEVTNAQFARFLAADTAYAAQWRAATTARFGNPPRFAHTADSPQVAVSWYDAARYCNWLSEQAGLPRDQWVYPDTISAARGLTLPPDYLRRTGYRLPTEAEWEFAARAGTTTARHFGDSDSLLSRYAWYVTNSNEARSHPVAQLLPNQWGLFDILGNVWEWTLDRRQSYGPADHVTADIEDSDLRISNDVARTRRGGSFAYEAFAATSAHRGDTSYFPQQTRDGVGFRVARTMAQP